MCKRFSCLIIIPSIISAFNRPKDHWTWITFWAGTVETRCQSSRGRFLDTDWRKCHLSPVILGKVHHDVDDDNDDCDDYNDGDDDDDDNDDYDGDDDDDDNDEIIIVKNII